MTRIKQLFLVLLICAVQPYFAQDLKEHEVPKLVKTGFSKKYPNVYVYNWEWKKKKQVYEAEFKIKGEKYEAYFTDTGTWVKTERDLKEKEIPAVIWNHIKTTEYADWKVEDTEEHSTPQYKLLYEIELKIKKPKKKKVYLYYLPNGNQVNDYKKL